MCCFLLVPVRFLSFTFIQRNIHISASRRVDDVKLRRLIDRLQTALTFDQGIEKLFDVINIRIS